MVPRSDGLVSCARCGHVVEPLDPDFRCTCRKCRELNQPVDDLGSNVGKKGATKRVEFWRRSRLLAGIHTEFSTQIATALCATDAA